MSRAATEKRVTVAICTRDRADQLRNTLASLDAMHVPDDLAWELLIIDNGSTDRTSDVIASYRDRLPVRRVEEPRVGLSNARNRAVQEASGRYVVWTDDDVIVDVDWLSAYVRAFDRWPGAAVFGGPIDPRFEGSAPEWIPLVMDQIGPVYGQQSLGREPVRLHPESTGAGPYGGNMAMARSALLRHPFDPDLGAREGRYVIGEETEVIRSMLEAGLEGWWTPDPRVSHVVPTRNQTVGYVRRWMVGVGRYMEIVEERDRATSRNHPIRLCVRILRNQFLYLLHRRFSPPSVWIRYVIGRGQEQGRLLGRLRHLRTGADE